MFQAHGTDCVSAQVVCYIHTASGRHWPSLETRVFPQHLAPLLLFLACVARLKIEVCFIWKPFRRHHLLNGLSSLDYEEGWVWGSGWLMKLQKDLLWVAWRKGKGRRPLNDHHGFLCNIETIQPRCMRELRFSHDLEWECLVSSNQWWVMDCQWVLHQSASSP